MKTIKLKSKTYRKTKKIILLICLTPVLLSPFVTILFHSRIFFPFAWFFALLLYLLFNNICEEVIEENKSN